MARQPEDNAPSTTEPPPSALPGPLGTAPEPRAAHLCLLGLACVLLLVLPLGFTSLWSKHEGRFFEGARHILVTGDWLVPHNHGEPLVFYPPLTNWLVAISAKIFGGITPFSARLPFGLAAIGCVFLTFKIGERLFDRWTGLIAAWICLCIPAFANVAIKTQPDTLMLLLMMVSYYAFIRVAESPRRCWPWAALFWAAFSVNLLTKGLPGAVFTLSGPGLWILWERRWRMFIDLNPLLAVALVATITPPWFIMAGRAAGPDYLRDMWQETFGMAFGGRMSMHADPNPFYYVPKFLVNGVPWTVFALTALFLTAHRDERGRSAWRFLVCWLGTIFVILSVLLGKRFYYILPLWPCVALLAATWWTRTLPWTTAKARWRERVILPVFVLGGLSAAITPWAMPGAYLVKLNMERPVLAVMGAILAIACFIVFYLHISDRRRTALAATLAGFVVSLSVAGTWGAWTYDVEDRKGVEFIQNLGARLGPGGHLYVYRIDEYITVLLNEPFKLALSSEQVAVAAADPNAWLLADKSSFEGQPALVMSWEPVATAGAGRSEIVLCRPRR